jgi:hypothetical protein
MNFKEQYPDFAAIEGQIHAARAERALHISQVIVAAIESAVRGVKTLGGSMGRGFAAERQHRAVEADAFLRRSVPKY